MVCNKTRQRYVYKYKGELNDNLGEINRQSVVSVKGIVQELL